MGMWLSLYYCRQESLVSRDDFDVLPQVLMKHSNYQGGRKLPRPKTTDSREPRSRQIVSEKRAKQGIYLYCMLLASRFNESTPSYCLAFIYYPAIILLQGSQCKQWCEHTPLFVANSPSTSGSLTRTWSGKITTRRSATPSKTSKVAPRLPHTHPPLHR
jgi:hypothetical protein